MSFAPLSETIAWDNIRTLSNFTVGDKPLVDSKTGKLSIEDRSLFVSFRRYLASAFNPEIIRLTFEKAVKTIEDKKLNSATELENVEIAVIDRELLPLFHKALEGLGRLQKTYEDENKAPVAERLGAIATEYLAKYEELSKPPVPTIVVISEDSEEKKSRKGKPKKGPDAAQTQELLGPESDEDYEQIELEDTPSTNEKTTWEKLADQGRKIKNCSRYLCCCFSDEPKRTQ